MVCKKIHVTAHGLVKLASVPRDDEEIRTGKEFHIDEGDLDVGQHEAQVKSGCSSKFFSSCYWEKQVIEGKIKGEIEVTRRRGRRCKKLLDDLKDRRGYSHLKEEALDCTIWRNHFGRGVGPVVRQNT
jgi:hypothetical protein